MASSEMLRSVALVRTDVPKELSSSFIRMASVLTRTTLRNIPEDAVLHSPRRENLKSYRSHLVSSLAGIMVILNEFFVVLLSSSRQMLKL
jgi:hypothetical protein